MKVGILGSGNVAERLSGGFIRHGHYVIVSTRDPSKHPDWGDKNSKVKLGTFKEAAMFGELIVLAVKGMAAADAIRSAGIENLAGKTVIDVTNPIADTPPENGVLHYYTTLEDSQMERLQREFPDLHFVKAFNSVGNEFMVNPHFKGGKPTMFICGNSEAAKKTVIEILYQFGWDFADMGKVEAARAIEPLCMLWCIPGLLHNQWTHAFKLLT